MVNKGILLVPDASQKVVGFCEENLDQIYGFESSKLT